MINIGTRLRRALEGEITARLKSADRLRAEISKRQDDLLSIESRLQQLRDMLSEGKSHEPVPFLGRGPQIAMGPPPTQPKPPILSYGEPAAVDFIEVKAWSYAQKVTCNTWDDLPAVNRKRIELYLPPFKRLFSDHGKRFA